MLNGDKYRVIGVMPLGFSFPTKDADLWIPVAFTSQELASRGEHYLQVIARLRPGVSLKQANTELQVLAQRLIRQNPDAMKFVDGFGCTAARSLHTALRSDWFITCNRSLCFPWVQHLHSCVCKVADVA